MQEKNINFILNILLCFSIIVAASGFIKDLNFIEKSFSCDLFMRINSAKQLQNGINPYEVTYSKDGKTAFLYGIDSWNNTLSIATPVTLFLHSFIKNNNYICQQKLWLFTQWILILLTLILFSELAASGIKSKIICIFGLAFILGSDFWRLHVERGQIYVFYTFLMTLAYYISIKYKKYNFFSGVILGITSGFRLHTIFFSIPLLIFKSYKIFAGMISGFIISIFITVKLYGINIWKEYFNGVEYFNKILSGEITHTKTIINCVSPDFCFIPQGKIYFLNLPFSNSSIQYVLKNKLNYFISPKLLLIYLLLFLSVYSIILIRLKFKELNLTEVFFTGSCFLLLSEYFSTYCRFSYCNVIWILPFAFIIILYRRLSDLLFSKTAFILLFAIVFNSYPALFPDAVLISEYLMLLYFIVMNIQYLKSKKVKHI